MSFIYIIEGKRFVIGDTLTNSFHVERLLGKYSELFVNDLDYSVNTQLCATINTGYSRPIYDKLSLSNHENNLLRQKVFELLDSGHLEHSNSNWSSPARTRYIDGKLEICVDYNKLNDLTVGSNNSLPNCQNIIDSIEESKFFSKIVIKDGLHQIALDNDSRCKTAFETSFGHFQWRTYHSGLKNAQSDLQSLTSSLQDFVGEFNVKVYLGHILVHSRSYMNHFNTLKHLFWHLEDFNLKVDIAQSSFFMSQVTYLGHFMDDEGVWITQEKLSKIIDFDEPTNKSDLRRFLGMISQYKSYISDFDQISQPLYNLISNANIGFRWGHLQRDSFNILKDMISNVCPLIGFF